MASRAIPALGWRSRPAARLPVSSRRFRISSSSASPRSNCRLFQFDAQDAPPGQVNYWGYAPVSFFAPHQAYSSRQDALGPVDEFRDMVKALHRAGIEVILDVVFNHTAEGDQQGPTLSFRGVDNSVLHPRTRWLRYANYTGTGTPSTPIIPSSGV